MTPFGSFQYFGILLIYIAIPTIVIGLVAQKHLSKVWLFIAASVMFLIQYLVLRSKNYSLDYSVVYLVLGYVAYQLILSKIYQLTRKVTANNILFALFMVLSLIPLVLVKVVGNMPVIGTLGFIGISYATFRSLDILIGIKNGTIKDFSILEYIIYLTFFATISSGPIDRYNRFHKDWTHKRTRAEFVSDLNIAIHKVFMGFLYKFIIGSLISTYVINRYVHGGGLLHLIFYMYGYSLYLFFDFAGYSNFAIGASYLFGIHTPENFNMPFIAKNIKDFWNRWHMTLSFWFRDNIYTPIVFTSIKNKWFGNNRYVASYIGYFVTMTTMGVWHGLTWYYIAYGIYHATLLILNDVFDRWHAKHPLAIDKYKKLSTAISIAITFNLVCFGLLLFSGRLAGSSNIPATK